MPDISDADYNNLSDATAYDPNAELVRKNEELQELYTSEYRVRLEAEQQVRRLEYELGEVREQLKKVVQLETRLQMIGRLVRP